MPNGGVFGSGNGLQLQPTTPGVSDTGNANISGTLLTYDGAAFYKRNGAFTNLVIGEGNTFNYATGFVQRNAIYIGPNNTSSMNPNGNNANPGVMIGISNIVADHGGVVIGNSCVNGSANAYPTSGAYNVVIGNSAQAYSIFGGTDCSIVIGLGCKSGQSGASRPVNGEVMIGNQCQSGGGVGRNVYIGQQQKSSSGNNNILINGNPFDATTNSNWIKIGDATHTGLVQVGPYVLSPSNTSTTVTVADTPVTLVSPNGKAIYTSITAARIVTLMAANAVPAGFVVLVTDASGNASGVNTITLTRVGADTINGGTTAVLNTAFGSKELVSDGVSKWTVIRTI